MTTSTIYLLYYRAPYEDEPELIGACNNQTAASNLMYLHMHKFPDAYPDIKRFETKTIELYEVK